MYFWHIFVCVHRDLCAVLDGSNEINKSVLFSNGKTTIFLPSGANTATNNSAAVQSTSGVSIATGQNKSAVAFERFTLKHLCEHVDCNKPLFGK